MTTSPTVSVGTSPTLLSTGRTGTWWKPGHTLGVQCPSADLFVGKDPLTLSTTVYMAKIPAGANYSRHLEPGEELYGVVASGTAPAHLDPEGVDA